jgi:hypothetical protein
VAIRIGAMAAVAATFLPDTQMRGSTDEDMLGRIRI